MSEMSKVEEVARAMCIDAGEDPDTPTPHNKHVDFLWQHYRRSAKAAIEALKKPTPAMQLAVSAQWGHRTWSQYVEVIDAALKE